MMCPKNPKRTVGTPVGKTTTTSTQSSTPEIVAKVEPVPVAQLPNFSSPESKQAPPPGASASARDTIPLQQVAGISSAEAIRPLVDVILGHLESRVQEVESGRVAVAGPPKPIPEQDKAALASIYGAVLDKHLPAAWMAKWGLEVAAVLLTVTIVVPKVLEYRAYFKGKQEKQKQVEKQRPETGFTGPYSLQGEPSGEALKDAYDRAVAQGRIPA